MKFLQTLLAGVLFCASSAFAGPLIFLFDGDGSTGYRVDYGVGVTTFQTFRLGYPVAISDGTIRLHDRLDRSSVGGAAYDLNGVPTGATFAGHDTPGIDQLLDGTTDGSFNYAVQCCVQGGLNYVWRASTSWQGFERLFVLPDSGFGIAFDTARNSLYVSSYSELWEFSLTGALLNTYTVSSRYTGLSYDEDTDTFYAYNRTVSALDHLSPTGAVLDSFGQGHFGGLIFGGEMAMNGVAQVPEPATLGLTSAAAALLLLLRRRNRA